VDRYELDPVHADGIIAGGLIGADNGDRQLVTSRGQIDGAEAEAERPDRGRIAVERPSASLIEADAHASVVGRLREVDVDIVATGARHFRPEDQLRTHFVNGPVELRVVAPVGTEVRHILLEERTPGRATTLDEALSLDHAPGRGQPLAEECGYESHV